MNQLYLDIFSGISGDMFVGALLDLGAAAAALEGELDRLGLKEYHVHVSRQMRGKIAGTKFDVHTHAGAAHHHHHGEPGHDRGSHHHHAGPHAHPHEHSRGHGPEPHAPAEARTFADIKRLIQASALSPWVKEKSVAVFQRVAQAEGKIHGQQPEQVHFHEVGAIDSIIDIVGGCVALELLGKPRVLAGPAVEGTGTVQCAHGCFPLPAPATLEILGVRGVPITQCAEPAELITPTGAALLAEFAESFAPLDSFVARRIGYGLGTRENKTRPNVLRALLGDPAPLSGQDWETDTVAVLESNLDDLNPEVLGAFMEKALAAGALDVFHTAIQMKKSRPGTLLTILCPPAEADRLGLLMLSETSAFGVRQTTAQRCKLIRQFKTVQTCFGEITVKFGLLNGQVLQVAPEFESCKLAAERSGAPLKKIYEAAIQAANA